MKKYLSWKIFAIVLFTAFLAFFDLNGETQSKLLPFTPNSITSQKLHLGLDLQGGSQLDYKIDLRKVPDAEKENIISGVLEVIEKRVNRLGVAEPNIYVSDIAGETHIIVELAETGELSQDDVNEYLSPEKNILELTEDEKKLVSLEKAKATVGKTIQLEFKEEKTTIDENVKEEITELANKAFEKINSGNDFAIVGREEEQAYPGKAVFEEVDYTFPEGIVEAAIKEKLPELEVGEIASEIVETGGTFIINESGQPQEETGVAILKLIDKKDELKYEKEVSARHILISYVDAERADPEITRTKEEAQQIAIDLKQRLTDGEDFTEIAQEFSDDKSNSEDGGTLVPPVRGEGVYVADFEEATLALENTDQISDIIETEFGFHIIKADEINTDVSQPMYKYQLLKYSTVPDQWQSTALTGEHFVHAEVLLDNFYQPYVSIQFDSEGADLFEQLTERNIGKSIAIFVGGELISAPRVSEKIAGGIAQITGQFTQEEASRLARDLNTGAIPAPIILTGEYTIGASLGQAALDKSLAAGIIGIIIVMVFMTLFYRIPGLIASFALFAYSAVLIFLLKAQISLGISLVVSLGIFFYIIYKIVNNEDSGWEKFVSFILSCAAFFFITFLLKTPVILTLAGVAGIILSIGIAVDANILIFERVKEELRSGRSLNVAIENGFSRAWSAIRDSNFSTLITCAILFYFGSSIIRGFAFNLAAGVLVSMFTAITITQTLLRGFIGKKIAKNLTAFGATKKKKENTNFKFISKSKVWLGFSTLLILVSIISFFSFGLNLGIDFTGGSLMEIQFEEEVDKELLAETLREIGEEINIAGPDSEINLESSEDETTLSTPIEEKVDLSNVQILAAGENNYIIKTKYLSSESHDQAIQMLGEKEGIPSFTESRFTTIGPTLGKTLFEKAMIAVVFTLIMIIVYIGIAFRKIKKEASPWRFGACAIAALVHDVIIVTGLFVILGQFFNVEIDALFITAMLTVFGYSVNDTIVVFDRLRENLIHSKAESLKENADKALNQTLTRSINTSLSTLIALVSVLIWGSDSIFFFILALTAGTVIGTYSSIFVASPLLVKWDNWSKKEK